MKLGRSLYRSFLRFGHGLSKKEKQLYLQHHLDPHAETISWLQFNSKLHNKTIINNLLNWPVRLQNADSGLVQDIPADRFIDGKQLNSLVRKGFESYKSAELALAAEEKNEGLDFAISALRELSVMKKLTDQTSRTAGSSPVQVLCTSVFSAADSLAHLDSYAHYYRILVENQSDKPVRAYIELIMLSYAHGYLSMSCLSYQRLMSSGAFESQCRPSYRILFWKIS